MLKSVGFCNAYLLDKVICRNIALLLRTVTFIIPSYLGGFPFPISTVRKIICRQSFRLSQFQSSTKTT